MSPWLLLMYALILAAPPTVVIAFTIGSDLYQFHGGSLMNETPVPVAGAGLAILIVAVGASFVARRFRRKVA